MQYEEQERVTSRSLSSRVGIAVSELPLGLKGAVTGQLDRKWGQEWRFVFKIEESVTCLGADANDQGKKGNG